MLGETKKATKAAPSHPPVAVMVTTAITELKERNGSSLPAIKKFLIGKYNADIDRLAPFIRKFLKKAVGEGKLKQIKASYKVDKTKVEKPKPAKKPKKAEAKPKKAKTAKPKATPRKSPKKAAAKDKKAKSAKKATKAEKPKKVKTPKKTAKPKKSTATKKTSKKAAKKWREPSKFHPLVLFRTTHILPREIPEKLNLLRRWSLLTFGTVPGSRWSEKWKVYRHCPVPFRIPNSSIHLVDLAFHKTIGIQ